MDYHLDDAVRQIPGKVTSNCNFAIFTVVLDLLDEEHANILRRSCLWPLYSLCGVQFSGQLLDALLCRLLKPVDGDALRFDLGGKVVTFSIFEFALITGLICTGEEAAHARIPRNKRLLNEYFPGQTTVTPGQLVDAFRVCDDMSDRLKLGLVLILESVLRCHHKKTSIDVFHLEVVDDIDAFNSYPWGQRCFADTLRHFKRGYSIPKGDRLERKYDAYGLPLGLQIWVYETVPILASRYARRVETCYPRIYQWRAQDKPLAKQISALLDDPEVEVLTKLTPSIEEEGQSYMRCLSISTASDDQKPESIIDRDRECRPLSPPSRRSPPSLWASPPSLKASPVSWASPPPMASPPPIRSPSPKSTDLYDRLTEFIAGQMGAMRQEFGQQMGTMRQEFGQQMGAMRREFGRQVDNQYARLSEEMGEMRSELMGQIDDVYNDVGALRRNVVDLHGEIGDLQTEVVALRGDIAALRGTRSHRDGGGADRGPGGKWRRRLT